MWRGSLGFIHDQAAFGLALSTFFSTGGRVFARSSSIIAMTSFSINSML